jgi:8-oxo-dGTP diphosphatase
MAIATDQRGNQLLSVIPGEEATLIASEDYRPLTSAFLIVRGAKGFMLLKNKYRLQWELPGGVIEQGETPGECAVRECLEESGYQIDAPRFVGLAQFSLQPDYFSAESRIEYTALYCGEIREEPPFRENDEISARCWYTPGCPLDDASPLDVKLLDYYTRI